MRKIFWFPCMAVLLMVWGCSSAPREEVISVDTAQVQPPSLPRYEMMRVPEDNPLTQAKIDLGKMLYYDKRLSGDESRSCYSCHLQENGLTDGKPTAIGAYEAKLPRASPTLWNIGFHQAYYWDGRSPSLERQAMAAWTGGNMGVSGKDGRPSATDIAAKLNQVPGYQKAFQRAFGGPATPENMMQAISSFERTIVATNAAWTRFSGGDESALNDTARRGWALFSGKAGCTNCHDGMLLTDQQYHNVGIGMDAPQPDVGRFTVTKDEKDTGAFKTPTLLDISKSAPYFHNGSVATLGEAVDVMLGGGKKNKYLDTTNLKPVRLTKTEREDLLAFLRSLDAEYPVKEPALP
ncbi:MAG: cytochrome-c peroxidase [Candidatus Korobacteraceae bacterium]